MRNSTADGGRPARLARFRAMIHSLTHDDDNLRAASTSTTAAFAWSEGSMRWTNSWGRGLNRSAGRAPGHCVLRWRQDVPSFPHAPFLAPALSLCCASDSFSLTKPNTSCKIEWPASLRSQGVRVHREMPFGFPSAACRLIAHSIRERIAEFRLF